MSEHNFVIGIHVRDDKLVKVNKVLGYRVVSVPSMKIIDLKKESMLKALQSGIQFCNVQLREKNIEFMGSGIAHYPQLYNGRVLGVYAKTILNTNNRWNTAYFKNDMTVIAKHGDYVYAIDASGSTKIVIIPNGNYITDVATNRNNMDFQNPFIFTNMRADKRVCGRVLTYKEAGVPETKYNSDGSDKKLEQAIATTQVLGTSMTISASGTLSNMKKYNGKSIRIEYPVNKIGLEAFKGNDVIERVEIGKGVETVSGSAFRNCTNLKELKLGDSITSIGPYAFDCCYSLRSVVLPNNSALYLGHGIFGNVGGNLGCKITLPDKLRLDIIKKDTIGYGTILLGVKVDAPGAHDIKTQAFVNKNNLRVLVLTNGYIRSIADYGLYGCKMLQSLDLRRTTDIGIGALAKCEKIQELELDEIENIAESAFHDCVGLKKIIIRSGKLKPIMFNPFSGKTGNIEIICTNKNDYDMMKFGLRNLGSIDKLMKKLILDEHA